MQDSIEWLFNEGISFYEQGKMDEAEIRFTEALKLDSTSEEIKYNLALVYLEQKNMI